MTLRDELAAVLGPGNDDRIAYAQADSVLSVLAEVAMVGGRGRLAWEVDLARAEALFGPFPPDGDW